MRLNELSNTLTITERKINDVNVIKSKIESRLIGLNARITKVDNEIIFSRRKLYSQLGTLITRYESLGFMREGKIDISKKSHSIQINWAVKLDSLYFFALCCSIVAGITMSLFLETEPIISLSTGIMFFLMFVFIGIVFIKSQLNDLINSCVYRNYY